MSEVIVDVIKRTALATLEQSKPMQIRNGIVISASPLKIQLSQKEQLDRTFFSIGQRQEKMVFEPGDKLILLRYAGGQKYLIYDKEGVLP